MLLWVREGEVRGGVGVDGNDRNLIGVGRLVVMVMYCGGETVV